MNSKKIIELIASIFILAIFISSYAYITTFAPQPQSQKNTTNTNQPTLYAAGITNASITGYNNLVKLNIQCKNQSEVSNKTSSLLGTLEGNNSISNFYQSSPQSILVQAGSMNTSSLYNYLYTNIGNESMACMQFSTNAEIKLPSQINFTVEGKSFQLPIPSSLQSYSLPINVTQNMEQTIKVRVAVLLTLNGTIYSGPVVSAD